MSDKHLLLVYAVILMIVAFFVTGCSYGPFHLEQESGKMPKGYMEVPYGGKVSASRDGERIQLYVKWHKEFN
jgi:hypothetical protein